MSSSYISLIIGAILIVYSINASGDLSAFYDLNSIIITVGGTFAATFAAYPLDRMLNLGRVLRTLQRKERQTPEQVIELMVSHAEKARRDGLLALEDDVANMQDSFLQKGVQLIVDGTDPELVRSILETELNFIEGRHKSNAAILDTMANLAPAFGMIGTLIGLINMLRDLDDASMIASGMAVALITTFYGSTLANLVFTPLATRLRFHSSLEILLKEVMVEGVLSIQAGENPRIVEEKLKAFLAPKREALEMGTRRGAAAVRENG